MKKLIKCIMCVVFAAVAAFGFASCSNGDDKTVKVYAPDGATALALAHLMAQDDAFDREVYYEIVNADNIHAYVTGNNLQADICILPLNRASILLGSGETYKMLGTVTHGNLFIMKKEGSPDITKENLQSLIGKTVGVVQLNNVPGLTFKLILNDNGISFNVLGNGGQTDGSKVNLKAVTPDEVLPTDSTCDYFVVPEPAASTKQNATGGKLSVAGSLQELYGGKNGYPQAVIVAKTSLISSARAFIGQFIDKLSVAAQWLLDEGTSVENIVSVVASHVTDGMSPSLNMQNLTKEVIENCAVRFERSADCKEEVNAFLQKLIDVDPSAACSVSDSFFYV